MRLNHSAHILVGEAWQTSVFVNDGDESHVDLRRANRLLREDVDGHGDVYFDQAAGMAQKAVRWSPSSDLILMADRAVLRKLRPYFRVVADVNVVAEFCLRMSGIMPADLERIVTRIALPSPVFPHRNVLTGRPPAGLPA